jgi:hypothetical protein
MGGMGGWGGGGWSGGGGADQLTRMLSVSCCSEVVGSGFLFCVE